MALLIETESIRGRICSCPVSRISPALLLQMNLIGRRSRRANGRLLKGLRRSPKRKFPW